MTIIKYKLQFIEIRGYSTLILIFFFFILFTIVYLN